MAHVRSMTFSSLIDQGPRSLLGGAWLNGWQVLHVQPGRRQASDRNPLDAAVLDAPPPDEPPPMPMRGPPSLFPDWLDGLVQPLVWTCVALFVLTVVLAIGRMSAGRRLRAAESARDDVQSRIDEARVEEARLRKERVAAAAAVAETTQARSGGVQPQPGKLAVATASGDETKEPETPVSGGGDPAPPKPSFQFADDTEIRAKADKARVDREWKATLASGLPENDEVTVRLAGGGKVLGCELTEKRKNNWELKQASGDTKLIARCNRSGGDLELVVPAGPVAEWIRYLPIEVEVTSPGAVSAARHTFVWADPPRAALNLTPVRAAKDEDPLVRDCGDEFQLFAEPEVYRRLSAILTASPELELKLDFGPGGRLAADGGRDAIAIKRLQSHDGEKWDVPDREVCGLMLTLPDRGDKAAAGSPFKFTHYWIQNPSTNSGPASLEQGIRIPKSMDGRDVDAELEKDLKDATRREADSRVVESRAGPPESEKRQAAAAMVQKAYLDRVAAEEGLRQVREGFDESKQRLKAMSLKDFQNVPVRVTLRRSDVDEEIVIVDSLGK